MPHTEATKQKIRLSNLGQKRSPETCRKLLLHRLTRVFPKKKTSIEITIENLLSSLGIKYQSNYPIPEAKTQVDFLLPNKIVIYCDGDYWHNIPSKKITDKLQNKTLLSLGYTVLRFWETEIKNSLSDCKKKIQEVYYAHSRME